MDYVGDYEQHKQLAKEIFNQQLQFTVAHNCQIFLGKSIRVCKWLILARRNIISTLP